MKVQQLFRRDINREVAGVVKVDMSEIEIVADEIAEYVVTDHLREGFADVVRWFEDTIENPTQNVTVWVSGFFGSGKSSFAKMLGHLFADTELPNGRATGLILERIGDKKIEALMNTVRSKATSRSVFLDMLRSKNVMSEGESIVLPVYRTILQSFGYAADVRLAELELSLEQEGRLKAFEEKFLELNGVDWSDRRDSALTRNQASRALHELDSATFPSADSWSKSTSDPTITAELVAQRAVEMLARRGSGEQRLVIVVDEVGQYVARSSGRLGDLQGLAEACQKKLGKLWLIATSQETLEDVVDSLEGNQVELAKVRDRFPITVDLVPSDIREVTSRRLLEKTAEGEAGLRELYAEHKNKLIAATRIEWPGRDVDLSEDEFVRLYPMVPYQVQLLIDAVSARRAQGAASPTLGGSNRTIIKLAQKVVIDPIAGVGNEDLGALVTMDRAGRLLEEMIPASWQGEIDQVAAQHGDESDHARLMRAVALTADVKALEPSTSNLTALLHPSVQSDPRRDETAAALDELVVEDRLRLADDGYHIQSPEQKDWAKQRRGKQPTPAELKRAVRSILRDELTGLVVTRSRSFKGEVTVAGEKIADGELSLVIEEADEARLEQFRTMSRESSYRDRVWWTYELSGATEDALVELHRSEEMIRLKDTPSRTQADLELIAQERRRKDTYRSDAVMRLASDLGAGTITFRGTSGEPPAVSGIKAVAAKVLEDRLSDIYPELDQFGVGVDKKDVLEVLRADNLNGLPESIGPSGANLVVERHDGKHLNLDAGPLPSLLALIDERVAIGSVVNGNWLVDKLAEPPRGATVEMCQLLIAAAVRLGRIEVTTSGARITDPSDHRLDKVFTTIPAFKSASFAPPRDDGPDLETRVAVAKDLSTLLGRKAPPGTTELAQELRGYFEPSAAGADRVSAALLGVGVDAPPSVGRIKNIVGPWRNSDHGDVILSAKDAWADLVADSGAVRELDDRLDEVVDALRSARAEVAAGTAELPGAVEKTAELAELLAQADLIHDAGRIGALAASVASMRSQRRAELAGELTSERDAAIVQLRAQFADLPTEDVDEALRPLDELVPDPDALAGLALDVLAARMLSMRALADKAAALLDEAREQGRLVRVRVSDIAEHPIASEEELDVVLARLRSEIVAHLADDKVVRIQ